MCRHFLSQNRKQRGVVVGPLQPSRIKISPAIAEIKLESDAACDCAVRTAKNSRWTNEIGGQVCMATSYLSVVVFQYWDVQNASESLAQKISKIPPPTSGMFKFNCHKQVL